MVAANEFIETFNAWVHKFKFSVGQKGKVEPGNTALMKVSYRLIAGMNCFLAFGPGSLDLVFHQKHSSVWYQQIEGLNKEVTMHTKRSEENN